MQREVDIDDGTWEMGPECWTHGEHAIYVFGRQGKRHPQYVAYLFHSVFPIAYLGPRYTYHGVMKLVHKWMGIVEKIIAEENDNGTVHLRGQDRPQGPSM
jgi:hypothetical protein